MAIVPRRPGPEQPGPQLELVPESWTRKYDVITLAASDRLGGDGSFLSAMELSPPSRMRSAMCRGAGGVFLGVLTGALVNYALPNGALGPAQLGRHAVR